MTTPDVVVGTATRDEAQARAEQIRADFERVAEWCAAVSLAYAKRDWEALGYGSWEDYLNGEYGEHRMRLPREVRREVVEWMRGEGMSIRAIAAATGNSTQTVQRDVDSGVVNHHTPPEPESSGDDDTPPPEPTPITGRDGKSYQPPKPKVQGERDPELTEDEQRERDRQQAIRRDQQRLQQLVNGWITLRSLPDNDWRDEILDGLVGPDRDRVVEIENIYLKGIGRE